MAKQTKVRYAVVGLGYIAQAAVLPAFAHARENSELVALVSRDATKRKKLGKKYGVSETCSYEDYEKCLRGGEIVAVYIALPNSLHRQYTEAAAGAGVHVLCEKPMAVTAEECTAMIEAARKNNVKLMIAYRLHFEAANLQAIEIVQSGKLGKPRIFASTFTMQVKDGDIRLQKEMGGGTLYDIGIYCINAARYLFRAEPTEVVAFRANGEDARFGDVEESISAIMRFPEDRMANFVCSFGGADVSAYEVVRSKGSLRLDPAYELASELTHHLTIDGKKKTRNFSRRDQFAPELIYFSNCIQKNLDPQPSGEEGLADVRIIEALYRSADSGAAVEIDSAPPRKRSTRAQEIKRPPIQMPRMVNATGPSPE